VIVRIHSSARLGSLTRWVSHALLGAGALSIGIAGWSLLDSAFYQSVQARQFDAELRAEAAAVAGPAAAERPALPSRFRPAQLHLVRAIAAPDPLLIGRLEIPRLALSVMVREGVSASTLRRAIGHVPGTPLPGNAGKFVVAGHRDTFFRGLRLIRTGDEVLVTTRRGAFRYQVDALSVVEPSDTGALQSTAASVCTLVTCFPFDYIGAAPRRFIVRASQITPP
jgi:sortase A